MIRRGAIGKTTHDTWDHDPLSSVLSPTEHDSRNHAGLPGVGGGVPTQLNFGGTTRNLSAVTTTQALYVAADGTIQSQAFPTDSLTYPLVDATNQGGNSILVANAGSTNTTRARTLADNVSAAGGGTIVLPAGTVDLSDAIYHRTKVSWMGRGMYNTTLRSASRFCFTNNTFWGNLYGCSYSDMTLTTSVDDSSEQAQALWWMDAEGVNDFRIERIYFDTGEAWCNGIFAKAHPIGGNTSFIRGLHVEGCIFKAIRFACEIFQDGGQTTGGLERVRLVNNLVRGDLPSAMIYGGFSLAGLHTDVYVVGNTIIGRNSGNMAMGIELADVQRGATVADNGFSGQFLSLISCSEIGAASSGTDIHVYGNYTRGPNAALGRLLFSSVGRANVHNNSFRLLGTGGPPYSYGVEIMGALTTGLRLHDNILTGAGSNDVLVRVSNAAKAYVYNNMFAGATSSGAVNSTGASSYAIVRDNTFATGLGIGTANGGGSMYTWGNHLESDGTLIGGQSR